METALGISVFFKLQLAVVEQGRRVVSRGETSSAPTFLEIVHLSNIVGVKTRDGEPETVKTKNRFLASVKNRKTGSWTEPEKNGEPVFSREPEPVLFLIFC